MSADQQINQAQHRVHSVEGVMSEAEQLDSIATRLMMVQRHWNDPNRVTQLADALAASRVVWHGIQTALAESTLALPLEVQHNLLILSVYADGKISACETTPSTEGVGSLAALTRTLAGSLKEWRVAA
ncbi:MAG: flagellar biosynthesis regulator FlaF [Thiobacillus sp.]|nr:flagellar biosynthesis regulator FlaF [Thiobacillus sp.]